MEGGKSLTPIQCVRTACCTILSTTQPFLRCVTGLSQWCGLCPCLCDARLLESWAFTRQSAHTHTHTWNNYCTRHRATHAKREGKNKIRACVLGKSSSLLGDSSRSLFPWTLRSINLCDSFVLPSYIIMLWQQAHGARTLGCEKGGGGKKKKRLCYIVLHRRLGAFGVVYTSVLSHS